MIYEKINYGATYIVQPSQIQCCRKCWIKSKYITLSRIRLRTVNPTVDGRLLPGDQDSLP